MAFTGNENHSITLQDAAEMTKRFRDSVPTGSIIGQFFGKQAILEILNQTNCVGIRIYYGLNEDEIPQMIISGVQANEDDIYEGKLAEIASKSPPFSGASNPLNS